MRQVVSVVLAALLTSPQTALLAAPALGAIQGTVTLAGRPVEGVDIVVIEIESGSMHRLKTQASGTFEAKLLPGRYVVTTENKAGLVVGHGPSLVPVSAGQVASANIDLLALAVPLNQEAPAVGGEQPAAPPTQGAVNFSPEITCFVAGEFPLLSAQVVPADKVARVRVYFKSALGEAYYYVEAGPGEGDLTAAKLPRPKIEASPITYYWQASFTDFGEVTGHEIQADVVESADKCGDKPVAPFGPPGPVQVFSAATGAAIAPAGFAAGALGAGAITAIVVGALGAGLVGGIVINNATPTPTPTANPTPTPTPTPTPKPTPTPTPTPTPPPPTLPPATPFR